MKIEIANKSSLKVSYYGETSANYDGHCLRAYSYFPEELPLIRLAEPNEKCYKITLDTGEDVYVTENDIVKYKGTEYKVNDFVKKYLST